MTTVISETELAALMRSDPKWSRQIAMSGTRNFRDLGAYPTSEGCIVRRGLLFRSASLHALTAKDQRVVGGLSLRRIIDLRSEFERTRHPDRIPADPAIQVMLIPILDSSTAASEELETRIRGRSLEGINPTELLTKTNVELASRFTPEYSRFVRAVLDAEGHPVLFHCAAGKDRTGFAAAILLRILGVPQEIVLEDYMLSNRYYLEPYRRGLMLIALMRGVKTARLIAGFLEVRPTFLAAAFDTIEGLYGSFQGYVHDGLQLTASELALLRRRYLRHM